ncbi:MAG: hypothetical protein R6U50_16315, partial [Desulfobacterales bacterium]
GGIYDHLGGGFHRYSTDEKWHVPHFEKMLYDNAQLIENCMDAFRLTGKERFKQIAEHTADYVLEKMVHKDGGFFSAEDADSLPPDETDPSKKVEGAYYVWDYDQLKQVLPPELVEPAAFYYGIAPEGNVATDPHGYFIRKNVLFVSHSIVETANRFGMDPSRMEEIIAQAGRLLYNARQKRERPHLDDKIITSWNGLMISALARAHQITGREDLLAGARRAAQFIEKNLYDPETGGLFRIYRGGEKKVSGMAEDYAFFVQALLDLYESDFDVTWLTWALELARQQKARFYDDERGAFFMTEKDHDAHLIVRIKDENDSVIPSANAVSVMNFMRLYRIFDQQDFYDAAGRTLAFFSEKARRFPGAMPQLLVGMMMLMSKPIQVVIAGDAAMETTQRMLTSVRHRFLPGMILICIEDDNQRDRLAKHLPFVAEMKPVQKSPTAFVCEGFSCRAPITDPADLDRAIEEALH